MIASRRRHRRSTPWHQRTEPRACRRQRWGRCCWRGSVRAAAHTRDASEPTRLEPAHVEKKMGRRSRTCDPLFDGSSITPQPIPEGIGSISFCEGGACPGTDRTAVPTSMPSTARLSLRPTRRTQHQPESAHAVCPCVARTSTRVHRGSSTTTYVPGSEASSNARDAIKSAMSKPSVNQPCNSRR